VHVRRFFRLLHPMNLYHRSSHYRAVIGATQRDYLESHAQREADPYPGSEYDRRLAASRQLPDVRAGDATSSSLAGLDARGLIYIRHGPPDEMLHGYLDPLNAFGAPETPLDLEGWLYHTPQGTLTIGFRRATGSLFPDLPAGDFIFLPANRRQAASTRIALETDRSTLPAPLEARAWSAFFKNAEPGLTDAYYQAEGDSAAVVLWDANDSAVRAHGTGLLQVTVPPGAYRMGWTWSPVGSWAAGAVR